NGIRHLFWDAGYGFAIKDAERSGWIVVAISFVATVLSWIVGLRLI
ncbi:MAG: succinate dehydrogenase, cytochrome b556 subunit, partial [Alphaproteobacteria bacterium]